MALPEPRTAWRGSVLQVRGLSVSFGPLAALQDVDLDVRPGEIVGIAGDNGAGKSTLLRCICGDLGDARGEVWLDGERVASRPPSDSRGRIGVVWQHLVLSDNLDAAANLMLGRERHRLLTSDARFHARAQAILDDLGISIADLTCPVWTLTTGQRQLLAIARSVSPRPRLLLLDEPTAALDRTESAHVERLLRRFHDEGTTTLLISHDVEQLFRLAGRIVVLRHGRVIAQVEPLHSHPDELLALMSGHDPSSAPRHQLSRLHGLADQLTAADRPASADGTAGLTLILSTLGAALGTGQLSLHLREGDALVGLGSVGLTPALETAWARLPLGDSPVPLVRALAGGVAAVEPDVAGNEPLRSWGRLLADAGVASWWAVPFSGGRGVTGVIGVYRPDIGSPSRDELDLVNLYAGYAAGTLERDRLLTELTARNKVLETIRSVLQTLAGPDALAVGLRTAVQTLREAVGADQVGLFGRVDGAQSSCRAFAGAPGAADPVGLSAVADRALAHGGGSGVAQILPDGQGGSHLLVRLPEAATDAVLVAGWRTRLVGADERVLFEDAAHSILLALERERAEAAHREASALRRSQEMQRQFLARLSHELRTPLTAIRGYASSLMQTDVTWDEASQRRFLGHISSESARLRRLVDDLLDFSMIESGMLRIRPDWVDLPLVIDAARSCLSREAADAIEICCGDGVPVVWGDHDRLEQVMMNLMDNAVRHNPPGTAVRVTVRPHTPDAVVVEVSDNGVGLEVDEEASGRGRRRPGSTSGAGLGLSITRGIVEAHRGHLRHEPLDAGTRFVVELPAEADVPAGEVSDV
ncbi:MAG TPA: ATP-binding cassette domain-containing protein [Segeticoccus sp.]|uniref:ATP-binding cassette domain-containing protein n=1 Tax=Segeticoccus sp. TaxID=2706531 RepID=UPI002D7FA186|nr:ATP-binding cassette domain-containing protein [Segeticoccus sp.]HET8601235.1 ATP-binding cassette domain-containing protein [Segeticoccus sp.]